MLEKIINHPWIAFAVLVIFLWVAASMTGRRNRHVDTSRYEPPDRPGRRRNRKPAAAPWDDPVTSRRTRSRDEQ